MRYDGRRRYLLADNSFGLHCCLEGATVQIKIRLPNSNITQTTGVRKALKGRTPDRCTVMAGRRLMEGERVLPGLNKTPRWNMGPTVGERESEIRT